MVENDQVKGEATGQADESVLDLTGYF